MFMSLVMFPYRIHHNNSADELTYNLYEWIFTNKVQKSEYRKFKLNSEYPISESCQILKFTNCVY